MSDLRGQVGAAINDVFREMNCRGMVPTRAASAQAADAVLAVVRERLAHDIAALAGERPAGAYECYDWDEAIAAAVAVVRGVGEAKP